MSIKLPISKSIVNRILLLQAIHGDPLMRVSSDMPDDVIVLHDALEQLRTHRKGEPLTLYLKNNGTALRFLQVHLEKCYPGEPITLIGDARLMERMGKPTTQITSARILHGEEIPVAKNESPYITMSRRMAERYPNVSLEADWSSAAFWYEYIAIHGGELLLEGLHPDSLHGDRIVAEIYATYFGVQTIFTPEGAQISNVKSQVSNRESVKLDFTDFPDLYPAVALTCERLDMELNAIGTERLRFKESDRIAAVQKHEVRNDHRMAMALMAADFPVSIDEQQCIAKSYPQFVEQWQSISGQSRDHFVTITDVIDGSVSHITPRKGINDDNLGKKHALSKLIHAATSEYVWLHDDDVILPPILQAQGAGLTTQWSNSVSGLTGEAGLVILPLKMESDSGKPSLLEKLQIAEYAAIQELTMRTAKAGKAVMCSGANLIARREAWLECEPDLHPEIPSGDDMFLLEAAKRRGMKISVIDEPDFTAVVRPAPTWRAFFRQRMRWAGKAPKYTDKDILRCGALIVAANFLQLLCPLIILIKFPIEYGLVKKREPRTKWYVALLLELLYPFYMFASLIGGFFRRKEW